MDEQVVLKIHCDTVVFVVFSSTCRVSVQKGDTVLLQLPRVPVLKYNFPFVHALLTKNLCFGSSRRFPEVLVEIQNVKFWVTQICLVLAVA